MLSSGKKRYLFIIHELGQNGNAVHSKDIASSLSVKQPSVSKMLNSLAEDGLIEKEYYGAATFTPEGARLSNKLYTDYLLLFSFFRNQLGLSEQDSRHDAIRTNPIISHSQSYICDPKRSRTEIPVRLLF